jgi:hypothetical protein
LVRSRISGAPLRYVLRETLKRLVKLQKAE